MSKFDLEYLVWLNFTLNILKFIRFLYKFRIIHELKLYGQLFGTTSKWQNNCETDQMCIDK